MNILFYICIIIAELIVLGAIIYGILLYSGKLNKYKKKPENTKKAGVVMIVTGLIIQVILIILYYKIFSILNRPIP